MSTVADVIKEWETERGPFSFETRIHPLVNPSPVRADDPIVFMTFIIDVAGFFLDEKHAKPIKLHRERVISINRFNPDPQYAEDLRKDLRLFTSVTYFEFEKELASLPQPTYTSDPLFHENINGLECLILIEILSSIFTLISVPFCTSE